MTTQLQAAPAGTPGVEPGKRWRADLDPLALPDTPDLTVGQRRILQACLELFSTQGYAGSSIRDIASAAGLQPASLYNHFGSKEAMLSALMILGHESHLDALMSAMLEASSEPGSQLYAMVHAHVLVHCEFPRLGVIVNHEVAFIAPQIAPQITAVRNRAATLSSEILRRGEEKGVFRLDGRAATTMAIRSMGVDAARWFPLQNDIGAEELASDYARLALRMVGAA